MIFKKMAMAASATALVVSPVIAQAANDVAPARTSSSTIDAEKLEGSAGIIVAILAAAAIIAGIIIVADGDEDDLPSSP